MLKEAEADFRVAADLSPAVVHARFSLGVVLMKQGRDDEGREVLSAYVSLGSNLPEVARARKLIENPRRARENFAPDYRLTTFDGAYLSSEETVGRTVLLDFWGTWCGPAAPPPPIWCGSRRSSPATAS